jgi:hypothetical protein
MKNAFKAGLLMLAVLALPAVAGAYGCPLFPNVGGGGRCTVQLGPWYLYYPYNAHFQLSAPVGPFPNWQTGAEIPGGAGFVPPGADVPVGAAGFGMPGGMSWQPPMSQPMMAPSGFVQPAGYQQQAPSYWYGNR